MPDDDAFFFGGREDAFFCRDVPILNGLLSVWILPFCYLSPE